MIEWKECNFGEIAEIIMGQSPHGESCNTFGKGVPLLNGPTEFTNKFPVPIQFTVDAKRLSRKGDILFCVRGSTTGKMNWSDKEYAIGRGLAAIRHKTSNDAQFFIRGVLDYYLPIILGGATGSTFPNVSGDELRRIKVIVPPLPEQTAIAEVLSSLDDKIDLLHRQNKTLEQIAETLFRQWFVEENNKINILGDLAKVSTGKGLQRDQFIVNGRFPVIGANGEIGKTNNFLNEEKLIITGRVGTLGEVKISQGQVWISDNVLIIKPLEPDYFYPIYFTLSKFDFENINAGSTQPLVTQTDLKLIEIYIGDSSLRGKFELQCADIFSKIDSNNQQINTLTQLRDTLLPKLMNREVRVENNL